MAENSENLRSSSATSAVASYRTRAFKKAFNGLPASVQELAREKFKAFRDDPFDPSLDRKALKGAWAEYESVRIGLPYRAVFCKGNRPGDSDSVYCVVLDRIARGLRHEVRVEAHGLL